MCAAVNSWTLDDSGNWETAADWSLGVAPTNSQSAIFITNGVAMFLLGKAVTIDATTVSSAPTTLNIQNLTVRAPGFPNYLIVTNATFTPLQVTSLTIGAGGVVEIANSELVMKPGSGSLIDDGSLTVGGPLGSSFSTTNAPFVIVGNAGSGQLAISSGSSLMSSNVIVGNQSGSSGTLMVSGGQFSIEGPTANLIVGNAAGANGALSLSGGSLTLSAASGYSDLFVGYFGVGQCTVSGGTLSLGGQGGSQFFIGPNGVGTLTIAGGTCVSSNTIVGLNPSSSGTVWVTGGQADLGVGQIGRYFALSLAAVMVVSNGAASFSSCEIDPGGTLTVAGGVVTGQDFTVSAGTIWVTGGQLIIAGQLELEGEGGMTISNGLVLAQAIIVGSSDGLGALEVAGGQLVATNAPVIIGDYGIGQMTLSSGLFLANNVIVGQNTGGQGSLAVPSGNWTVASSLVVGDCAIGASGTVAVAGGGLYVTNSTGTAVLDFRDGQINLNSGTLQVNKLVITNSCALFYQNGGTLIVSNLVLAPELSAVGDGIPNSWKQQYGLNPLDSTLSGKDLDGSGFTVLQDYLAGLNPTNSHSALRIISILPQGNNVQLTWTTAGGKTNAVQAVNGAAGGGYTTNFTDLASFVIGGSGDQTNTYIDPGGATNRPARFYRVRLVP